ncbi:protein phosphatase 2C domain-containing protein [Microcoleus sp. LEGE 07076]|uniref:protein phosphatase 2C domain-containing protein n=1 Tax=Microcoleus sp. LEGE 07076 TaxID=915322 RepID=UPI00187E8494|nr:protein phosphatase 2C domain-containing protein [Microcoleus sp. LEGE 07076]MBE9185458.1 protein phosphatase 2C domain-containing protein [Microcoleus sp. LEGE 07076]
MAMTKFNLVVNIEVAEGKGEDANLAEDFGQTFLMGVFDGLGGRSAGYGGKTGGRIASEESSQISKTFFKQWHGEIKPENVIQLQQQICRSLKIKADIEMQPKTSSRLKGSLVEHKLCTTIALASIPKQKGQERIFEANLAWMGDSRIYFLSPTKGLQQLTKDDLVTPKDALEMLRQDPPMSQYLTANINPTWQIHFQHYDIKEPGCFLACTDGCFQYFSAPWEFEKLLLEMLSKSEGDTMEKNSWQQLIKQRYTEIKQDDVSLILYPVGFNGIKHLKSSYQERLQYLQENFMAPTANARYEDVQTLWEKYKIDYEYYFQFIQDIQLIATSKLPVSEDYPSSSATSATSSLSTQELNQVFKQKAAAKAEEIQTLLEQAYSYYENNRLKEAQDFCIQVLNIEVHHSEAKYLLGLIFTKSAFTESNYNRGELFKKAASYFEELVSNKSAVEKLIAVEKIVESYRILGFIYYSLNSPNKSVDYYQIFFKSEGSDKLDNWQEHLNFFVISLRNSTGNKCDYANSAIQFCHRLVHNTKLLPYGKITVIYYFMAQLQEIEGEFNAALNSLKRVLENSLQLDDKMHQEAQQMYHKIMNKLNGRRY